MGLTYIMSTCHMSKVAGTYIMSTCHMSKVAGTHLHYVHVSHE